MLIFYLICLNPLKLKLSKIRDKKRTRLGLFFLNFLNFFLILLNYRQQLLLMRIKKELRRIKKKSRKFKKNKSSLVLFFLLFYLKLI